MKLIKNFFRIIISVFLPFFLCVSLAAPAAVAKGGAVTPAQEEGVSPPAVSEGTSGEGGASLEEAPGTSAEALDKGNDSVTPEAVEKEGGEAAQAATAAASAAATTEEEGDGGMGANISVPSADTSIFTGAAITEIPIIVPPGRGGIAPKLALRYNSYQGNGWVGIGWDLDLGAIQRSTKHGVDYNANDYVFVKDGSHTELVPRSDWGGGYYGAKIEGEFTKFYLNPNTHRWEVTAKDGTKYFYGSTDASKQINVYCFNYSIGMLGVFKWCLDRVEDPNGNYLTVSYTKDQGEIYPHRIDYTGNTSGLSTTNYVQFYLEDRTDIPVMYTSMAPVRTAKRLKTIEVVANGSRVRAYKLIYGQGESTSRSLFASVQQYGSDVTLNENGDVTGGTALPATDLQYTPEANSFGDDDISWGAKRNSAANFRMLADVNGDGKADFVYLHSGTDLQVMLAKNPGPGFEDDTYWGKKLHVTAVMSDGSYTQSLADVNGDGKADFFYLRGDSGHSNELWVVLAKNPGPGFVDDAPWGEKSYAIGASSGVPIWGLADMNGDGKADFVYLRSNGELQVMLSEGNCFDTDDAPWGEKSYGIASTSSGVPIWALADVNGDGKADFFYQKSGWELHVVESAQNKTVLLSSLTNGRGATTAIEYTHSSQYQNTLLPFIVHPVSRITVDDGLGNQSVTTYSYQGGLYDFLTREFRGFAYVKRTNPDLTIEETRFHQDEYRQGRQYQIDHSEPQDGPRISRTTLTWETEPESPAAGTPAFVKLAQKRTEYDAETVFSQEAYTYDDTNGNLLTKVASGSNGEQVTQTNQYQNYGTWLWRQTKETITGSTSGKVRETSYDYYSGTGNLHYETHWLNPKTHQVPATDPQKAFLYDPYGNKVTETDPRGKTTTTTYETTAYTYPAVITYPATNGVGHVVENEAYDYRFGKVTRRRDENGNHTSYTYDLFGRLQQTDHPGGGQVVMEYHDNVRPRYVVTRVKEDVNSTIDKYVYVDGLDREIETITFGEGGKTIASKKHYDVMGRLTLKEGPFFGAGVVYPQTPPAEYPYMQTAYDYRSRPVQITRPDPDSVDDKATTTFVYSGLATTITDPDGNARTEWRDYLNRVIQVTEHADGGDFNTQYTYNAAGDLLQILDHAGNAFIMDYDTLGRKIDMVDPDMGYWVYTYDPNGNLHTQLDAKGQTITMAYDELNRIISKAYSTADPPVTYTYDSPPVSNGIGRLASVSNTQTIIAYNAYDQMGRVQSLTKTIAGDQPRTTQYQYDLAGKGIKETYPDGFEAINTYHPGSGLLHTVKRSDAEVYATCTLYEPTGKMGQVVHGNNTATRYTYDPQTTRLTAIVTADPSGDSANDIQRRTYDYSPAGDIREITDDLRGITYTYTYDRLHRLLTETNTGPYAPLTYTYNAIGNMMTRTVGGDTYSYAYDSVHKHAVKIITFNGQNHTYSYDASGNMTGGPDFTDPGSIATRTITYNADNMPLRIVHPQATVDLVYDGNGTRAKKQVQAGVTTYYIGEHFELKDGVVTKYIFAGNLRVAMVKGQTLSYFHKDHLASSTAMTDAAGGVVEETEYMPYGLERDYAGAWVTDYKYTDQELDTESGLYNYDARHYDPVIGRFISPDSMVPDFYNPQLLNRYSYCRNNPLIYVDPSGHFFEEFWNWLWGNGWTANSGVSPGADIYSLPPVVSSQGSQGSVTASPSSVITSTSNNIDSDAIDSFRLTTERRTWYSRAAGESSFNLGGAWMYDEPTSDGRVVWPTLDQHRIRLWHSYGPAWDIRAPLGSPIFAAMDGIIEKKWFNATQGGNQFLIYHGGGWETGYAHTYSSLEVGYKVHAGDYIGISDASGNVPAHLHFAVHYNGEYVSPLRIGILDVNTAMPRWWFK